MTKKILILDTNVLLSEPQALYGYPNAEVIIPQTVLQELDKVKMTRSDRTLQYNGRLVSRYLFSISAAGNLTDGVELENDSVIKVVALNTKTELPPSLKTKFSDDQILAIAYQVQEENKEKEITLVTNDLNMLIKAQALGIKIQHHGGMDSKSKIKRFFGNQINTLKKNPMMTFFILLTLAGIISIIVALAKIGAPVKGPPEIIAQQQTYQAKESQYQNLLEKNSANQKALFGLAELYVEMGNYYRDSSYYNKAIDLLEDAPKSQTRNYRIDAMIARLHFLLEMTDVGYEDLDKMVATKSESAYSAIIEQAHIASDYKNYRLTIIFLNKTLKMKSNDIDTRLSLAEAYYNNDQINETIDQYHKALAIDDKNALIYFNLGYVYWQKRADATTAIGYFEKYIELDPKGQYVKQAKDYIAEIKKQV